MPDQAAKERGIIRALKRRLTAHPRSKKLRKSLARHRAILASLRPALRLRAFAEMGKLIGVTEVGGNNVGPVVSQIIRTNGGTPGEPWCGDTVAYAYLKAGAKSVTRAWASVSWLEKLLTRVWHPKRGNVVTYYWSHTGIFDQWAPEYGPGWFWAIEGNTGSGGNTSDQSGGRDGVRRRLRRKADAKFWRVLK